MAIYVTSDIHGDYEKYKKLLEKIDFKESDTLYILGDILDRGNEGLKIILDISERYNIIPLLGNHELLASKFLPFLMKEVTDESLNEFDVEQVKALQDWMLDGGSATINEFKKLSHFEREAVIEFLSEFSLAEEVEAGGKTFLMIHAGLPTASEWDVEDLDFDVAINKTDYNNYAFGRVIRDKYLITGHVPTFSIAGAQAGKIYQNKGHIAIDCGCAYGKTLGCLRLDDMQEFYVD